MMSSASKEEWDSSTDTLGLEVATGGGGRVESPGRRMRSECRRCLVVLPKEKAVERSCRGKVQSNEGGDNAPTAVKLHKRKEIASPTTAMTLLRNRRSTVGANLSKQKAILDFHRGDMLNDIQEVQLRHLNSTGNRNPVVDSHMAGADSHVTPRMGDREDCDSFESVTETIASRAMSISQEGLQLSSPKKKRVREPSITFPQQSSHEEEKTDTKAFLEAVPPISKHFHITSKIGEGTFSSVYLAHLHHSPGKQFALKHIVPISAPCRIENELKCLQTFGGQQHVIGLETCLRHRDHVVFVLPYIKHDRLVDLIPSMNIEETRKYMRALFLALQQVHTHHIIHRDIKPSNFLYNREEGRYQLVDFGLAHLESGRTGDFRGATDTMTGGNSKKFVTATVAAVSRLRQSPRLMVKSANNKTFAAPSPSPSTITATPTLPHALAAFGCRLNRRVPSSAAHTDLLTLPISQPSARSALPGRGEVSVTPVNKRSSGKEEGKSSDAKRVKKEGNENKRLTLTRRAVKKSEPKQNRTKSAVKPGRKLEESCELNHKETEVCELCLGRPGQNAPRAGTPGFRAPEVLLKCPLQTTAVDMWSAGVIFLCILSGRYPFFRAQDDLTALAQIVGLFGSKHCAAAAKRMGKDLVCRPETPGLDLKLLCAQLRSTLPNEQDPLTKMGPDIVSPCTSPAGTSTHPGSDQDQSEFSSLNPSSLINAPPYAFDLLHKLLAIHPSDRLSAEQALEHPFISSPI